MDQNTFDAPDTPITFTISGTSSEWTWYGPKAKPVLKTSNNCDAFLYATKEDGTWYAYAKGYKSMTRIQLTPSNNSVGVIVQESTKEGYYNDWVTVELLFGIFNKSTV